MVALQEISHGGSAGSQSQWFCRQSVIMILTQRPIGQVLSARLKFHLLEPSLQHTRCSYILEYSLNP